MSALANQFATSLPGVRNGTVGIEVRRDYPEFGVDTKLEAISTQLIDILEALRRVHSQMIETEQVSQSLRRAVEGAMDQAQRTKPHLATAHGLLTYTFEMTTPLRIRVLESASLHTQRSIEFTLRMISSINYAQSFEAPVLPETEMSRLQGELMSFIENGRKTVEHVRTQIAIGEQEIDRLQQILVKFAV
jgi:hypothetical protein